MDNNKDQREDTALFLTLAVFFFNHCYNDNHKEAHNDFSQSTTD